MTFTRFRRVGIHLAATGFVLGGFLAASAGANTTDGRPALAQSRAAAHGRALTGMQLAAIEGLTYQDARTYVMLERGPLRVRLYPDTYKAVVAGEEYTLKDRVERRGGDIVLSSRIVRFLNREIRRFRSEEQARKARTHVRRTPLPELPELPPPLRIESLRHDSARRSANRLGSVPLVVRRAQAKACQWAPPVDEREWKWVILHHSDDESGCVAKYDRYHRDTKKWEHGCGYHFVIGNGTETADGQIEMGPRWTQQLHGAHAKTPDNRYNDHGVGICLVGDFDEGDAEPTRAQMDQLVRLVHWLRRRYDIPADSVMGHNHCCNTECPGKNFPWDTFRTRIR